MNFCLFITRRGTTTWLCRTIAAHLALIVLLTEPPFLRAADSISGEQHPANPEPPKILTPKHVSVRHALPKFTPPSAEVSFSENPTDAEISKKQLLAEPLLPIGGQTTAAENKDLAAALTAFTKRAVRDDYTSLEDFVAAHPKSAWDISLLTDLGALYRRTGWYGKAMDTWQQAWKLGQAATNVDTTGKAIIDRALVESIVMNARVGRMEVLPSLIKTADQRRLAGSSKERVEGAKQALALMKTHPESSFRCGPMAVEKLRNIADNNDSTKWKVMSDTSTQQGTSLAQLTRLSKKLGMDMIPAQRQPGSPVLAPAVVNWKVGHFAAITEVENGLIHLSDPTFGGDVWISPKALDAEASGYFLVNRQSLPSGWSEVTAEGAAKVWGKGQVVGSDDTANGNKDAKTCNTNSRTAAGAPDASSYPPSNSLGQPFYPPDAKFGGLIWGMASASTHMMLASLSVQDTPLSYTPPIGPPVSFQISYSQREAYQPSVFAYSNLGPLWTFNWLTYISDDPSNPGANVTQYLSGGGTITYTGYNTSTHAYAPQSTTGAILRLLTYSSNYQTSPSYELDLPDGSKQTFSTANQATPRNVFLTQTTTPQGSGTSGSNLQNNSLTFSYDSNYRMTAVTDGIGQVTILYYGLSSDIYKITKVTDPFGRSAYFKYNPDGTLQSSTDTIGIVSSYGYKDGAMQSLTTPYGATTFDVGQDGLKRWVQITDPQGGQERVETWNDTGSLISSGQYTLPNPQDIPAGEDTLYGQYRNTFYWDKKAMMDAPGNYHMAEVVQWLESQTGGVSTMTGQMEDYQPPLEARVYYNYPGQPSTNVIGSSEQATSASRMLDSGPTNIATQTFLATYNSLGKRTQAQDPAGRTTSYAFDSTNNVDLQSTKQQNQSHQDTVFSASYNAQHEPTTITEASGQQTTLQYYGNGQVETITDALGNTSSFTYGSTKYLQNVKDGSTGATTSYTYDALGRPRTITDSSGYTVTYDYDNADRVTVITYPDGAYEQNVYTNLDLTYHKDRQNRWTHYFYNSVQQLIATIDPQGRSMTYGRCSCGELTSIADSYGHQTSLTNDIEGRLVTKTMPDGSQYNYRYEPSTSRLYTSTDPKSQVATFSYNLDNSVSQLTYTNSTISTPTVAFQYDPYYPRVTQMTDGTGQTQYSYYPIGSSGGGQIETETLPIQDSQGNNIPIGYSYDKLGRLTGISVDTSSTTTISLDSLNRIKSETDSALSSSPFQYTYYGATPRLQSIAYPNGQSTSYSYQMGTNQDYRLTDITNYKTGTTVLSKFDYTYNEVGTISSWKQQTDSSTPTIWSYQYDKADQLVSAVRTNTQTQAVLAQYAYGYDLAGNRTTAQDSLAVATTSFNKLNQISGSSNGGALTFTGNISLSTPAKVTVAGSQASVDANNNFSGSTSVTSGTNIVAVVATDGNGHATTNNYQVVVPQNTATSPSYDSDGNLVNNGAGQTYEWDAKNELTAINYSGGAVINGITRSQFSYDGQSRRVRIVEMSGSSVTSTKQFVWIMNRMVEERDGTGAATKRFFLWGEQVSGTSYYLTRDHLGSVREMTNASGITQARYDYDPYGNVSAVGTIAVASDFQYAGMYQHASSQLNLTQFRAYSSNAGRWLSRDPLGESTGVNLYAYASNNPVNIIDSSGLCPEDNCIEEQMAVTNQQLAVSQDLSAVIKAQQNVNDLLGDIATDEASIAVLAGLGVIATVGAVVLAVAAVPTGGAALYGSVLVAIGGLAAFYSAYQSYDSLERDERSLRAAQDVLATAQAKQMEDEQELIYLFQALYKCQNEAKGLSEKTPLIF